MADWPRKLVNFLMGGEPRRQRRRFNDTTDIISGQMVSCVVRVWNEQIAPDGEVLPVDAGPHPEYRGVYIVAAVGAADCGAMALMLKEFPDRWYRAQCFRPVKKTSIDIFRSLLTPTGQEGPASPVSPVRVASLLDRVEQGSCHYPSIDETLVLPPGNSLRATLAHALPAKVDGRAPLSHSCKSSVKSTSQLSPVDSKETSRCRRISPSSRSIAPQLRSVL